MEKIEEIVTIKLPLTSLEVSAINSFIESKDDEFISDMHDVIGFNYIANSHTYICGYLMQNAIDDLVCAYLCGKIKENKED